MRLPQDRILHIDTEFKDGKVNVVTEWQGEVVRCKDCKHYEDGMVGYCWKIDTGVKDDFFCSYGERKGGDE